MSVPKAVSEVSESPAKYSVARATDPKEKKADVDRKMRFYGVFEAFRQGRYPDNKQIDVSRPVLKALKGTHN